jgi:hypothetical protein
LRLSVIPKKKFMANFPMGMIPVSWELDHATVIICNGSRLIIDEDGDVKVEGSVKNAALGLVKYVVQAEFSEGLISWELNHAVRIEREDGDFTIEYVKPKKPACWDELEREFYRAVKMKAFW